MAPVQPGDVDFLQQQYAQWNAQTISARWRREFASGLQPLVLAGDWNGFNKSDSTLPWLLTRITAPAIPGTGTPDAYNWFTNTIHVAAAGGDTTPGVHSFALVAGTKYSTQWGGVTMNVDATTLVPSFAGTALGPTNSITFEDGFYYSFRLLEWAEQIGSSMNLAVFKTSAQPVSVSLSGQTPQTPTADDPVIVSITTNQPKSAEERIYLRWSTDFFITSHLVLADGSGTSYSATISPQTPATAIQYCVFTSTVDLSAFVTSGIIDSLTLAVSDNSKFIVSGTPPPIPPSITAQPASTTVTQGQAAQFNVTAAGTAPLTYQWQKNGTDIGGATGASYTTPATTVADNGALFHVAVTNIAGAVTSSDATLTVNSITPPSITTQPASTTVTVGQTAQFNVTATGTAPLTYQWQKNGANIGGATSASYTTPATTAADNGALFHVVVTNIAGTVTSSDATLTVNSITPPSITTQPANKTVTTGQTATFSVTAAGTAPLTYQWQKNGVNISGATSASYTTPATRTIDNGSLFHVIVTNIAGTVTSSNATLTVGSGTTPPSITTQPASKTVKAGLTVKFSVTATGSAPLTYQWQKNGANISGATSASYTTPATTAADNGSLFHVAVTNSAGTVTSSDATLTVTSVTPPSITVQPANKTVTAGLTATFNVTAAGTAPLTYQWQKNGANINGATSASYTTPATTTADNGALFHVVVTNSAGTVTSSDATLTVTSVTPPSITTQPASKTVRAGLTAKFSVTATGTAPLTYQWRKNGVNISGATKASYTTPPTTTADNGATFSVVVSNSAGSVTSNNATLTVN